MEGLDEGVVYDEREMGLGRLRAGAAGEGPWLAGRGEQIAEEGIGVGEDAQGLVAPAVGVVGRWAAAAPLGDEARKHVIEEVVEGPGGVVAVGGLLMPVLDEADSLGPRGPPIIAIGQLGHLDKPDRDVIVGGELSENGGDDGAKLGEGAEVADAVVVAEVGDDLEVGVGESGLEAGEAVGKLGVGEEALRLGLEDASAGEILSGYGLRGGGLREEEANPRDLELARDRAADL